MGGIFGVITREDISTMLFPSKNPFRIGFLKSPIAVKLMVFNSLFFFLFLVLLF